MYLAVCLVQRGKAIFGEGTKSGNLKVNSFILFHLCANSFSEMWKGWSASGVLYTCVLCVRVFVLRLWASACLCACLCMFVHVSMCVYIDCSCRKPKHLHFVHLLESKQEEAGKEREIERESKCARQRESEREGASGSCMVYRSSQAPSICTRMPFMPAVSLSRSLSPSRSRSSRLNCVNGLEIVFAPCAA